MWLEELQLTDFRGFRHLELDLRRQLTVVIGVNGAGKSSLVRAIEIGANHPVAVVGTMEEPAEHDIRLGREACRIELGYGGMRVAVTRPLSGKIAYEPPELRIGVPRPLCIVLKSDRAVLKAPWIGRSSRLETSFEHGERWFHAREDLENQERVRRKQLDYMDPALELARHAIGGVLPGYSDPHIDRSKPSDPRTSQLVLSKNGQELTADMLSEGERSQLVLAMTIARRIFEEQSTLGRERAPVVVIDEIELHLHPKWQRDAIPALLRVFPTCQFIITTHSPQVIGSVPRESIVVLEDFAVYDAPAPTEGRDSNAILEEIMDVPERSEAAGVE